MINDSLIDPSVINAGAYNVNCTPGEEYYDPRGSSWSKVLCIFFDLTILICIFGILGNGMVIWILGICIKRGPFTIFILNLALADFGVLVASIMARINHISLPLDILTNFFPGTFLSTFNTSQMFLTIISVDRCVSVFFPLWHRCHRPTWLPTLVCVLIWVLSSLTAITCFISYSIRPYFSFNVVIYFSIANGFLCIPLMTISSLMLFFKVCCKSRQRRRQKLLTAILFTIAFFLLCCFPFNTFMFVFYLNRRGHLFLDSAISLACLNSSINPLIYYVVGRRKEGRSNKSMKGILQNLFREEEI